MYEYFIRRPTNRGYLVTVTIKGRSPDTGIEKVGREGEYYCEDFKAVIELVSEIEKC